MDAKTVKELEPIKEEIGFRNYYLYLKKLPETAREIEWNKEGKIFKYTRVRMERPFTVYFWVWQESSGLEALCTFRRIPNEHELGIAKAIVYIEEQTKFQSTIFICKGCGKELHWTDITVDPLHVKHPIIVKHALYREENCGCGIIPYPKIEPIYKYVVPDSFYGVLDEDEEYYLKAYLEEIEKVIDPRALQDVKKRVWGDDDWWDKTKSVDFYRKVLVHNAREHNEEKRQLRIQIRKLEQELEELRARK